MRESSVELLRSEFFYTTATEMEIYYNQERAHQGLGNKIIRPEFSEITTVGEVERRSRLGGLMNYYYRKAA
jgi:hypothetical protein